MWFINYIKEVRSEMSHVTWPTPRQAVMYTAMVLVISLVVAIYLGALDFAFEKILTRIV